MRILSHLIAFLAFSVVAFGKADPAPLQFNHMPLGNVVRVISARFHTPVTILAGALVPVTGNFTGMDARQALEEAARQAGLTVVPLGAKASAGFLLEAPPPSKPGPSAPATDSATVASLRAELLQRRAELAKEASRLNADEPAP